MVRTQHTLAQATELKVGVLEGLLHLLVQRLLLALQQDGGTAVQDALRSALHHQQVPVVIGVLCLMDGELWTEQRTGVPEPRRGLEAAHIGPRRQRTPALPRAVGARTDSSPRGCCPNLSL